MSATPRQSPSNIEQDRAIGQDDPAQGSRQGREANKPHGYPGTADIGTNASQILENGEELPAPDKS
ncbi:MAG: hypothetical protein JWQ73_2278 [Variovorax sp.]|nr:hypothetical protein [Variovorax sp.]